MVITFMYSNNKSRITITTFYDKDVDYDNKNKNNDNISNTWYTVLFVSCISNNYRSALHMIN